MSTLGSMLLLFAGFLCLLSGSWAVSYFGTLDMSQIVYHLSVPMEGTASEIMSSFYNSALIPSLVITFLVFLLIRMIHAMGACKPGYRILLSLFVSVSLILCSLSEVNAFDYFQKMSENSSFFEENYVDPSQVTITFPEQKRNLIYIYVESYETTYLSKDLGGALNQNLIEDMATTAQEGINFSSTDKLGGFYQLPGTGWTIAAIVSQSAGIPLNIPVDTNITLSGINYLPGAYGIGQVLAKEGYNQEFLIGSDKTFASRNLWFEQHGNYKIYDYNDAVADDRIPADYDENWGYEDSKLFEYAKEDLKELAAQGKPFNLTLLTTNTHHPIGYLEDSCVIKYDDHFKAAVNCSSIMIQEFLRWLAQQDFYDNTTVVVTGDHLSMNKTLFENIDPGYERTVLEMFLNCPVSTDYEKNRQFSAFDMYPTTLASLGAVIEGDRLGLGTNLFSGKKTLLEQYGLDTVDDELSIHSDYYDQKIVYGK